uniref:Uncharacterized protein MANES_04G066800 n=1 Tax=Rhizophora mucronata TaxID=61149 RepID=A0A2P2M9G7_RHIMU
MLILLLFFLLRIRNS